MIPTSDHNEALSGDVLYSAFLNHEWREIVLPFIIAGMEKIAASIDDESDRQDFEVRYGAMIDDFYNEDFVDSTPVGTIAAFMVSWSNIPDKWILCDGATIAQADYPELTAVIDSSFISGSDIILPDLRQTFLRGALNSALVGVAGGYEEITLTVAQMPAHSHDFLKSTGSASQVLRSVIGNNTGSTAQVTSTVGGGEPHNNIPPFMYVSYAIKALP